MKKVAIVGSSNASVQTGYGQLLKNKYGKDCEIFDLAPTNVIGSIFCLLQKQIRDNFEFVIFDFTLEENELLSSRQTDKNLLISSLAFIAEHFIEQPSSPIFIIRPDRRLQLFNS